MGWATVNHPFHPLRGMRFEILECRTLNQQDIFSLKDTPYGTVRAVPREWTDRADPNFYQSPRDPSSILSFTHLLQLTDFLDTLRQAKSKKREG